MTNAITTRIQQKTLLLRQPLLLKLTLALAFAGITGICAQISVRLPLSEVPITLQTFAVFLSVLVLGRGWGSLSQTLYVILGLAGIPWFAGNTGGLLALSGPTGGYLIGFVFAALLIGFVRERFPQTTSFLPTLTLLFLVNFFIIHTFGLAQLWMWFSLSKDTMLSFSQVVAKGSLPFIVGDVYKIVSVAALSQVKHRK